MFSVMKKRKGDESVRQGLVKQQRQGIRTNLTMKSFSYCLIVTDYFPSILWLLDLSSNFSRVYMYLCGVLQCESEIIKLWKDRVEFIDSTKISGLIMSNEIFKFGIGRIDWIWNVWRKTNGSWLHNSVLICPYDRLKKKQFYGWKVLWTRIVHNAIGGVTKTRWIVGFPNQSTGFNLLSIIPSWGMERKLSSVLDKGASGKACANPPTNIDHLEFWNEQMNDKILMFPSYKSRSGWIERTLTFKEKALCFDWNELLITKISSSDQYPRTFELVNSGVRVIPQKVLQAAVGGMLNIWGSDKGNGLPKLIRAPKREENSESGKAYINILSKDDVEYLKFEQDYLVKYGEKASKNDDEPVPIELWDRYILRNRFSWIKYSPIVRRALSIIRNRIAIRWYLHKLRTSFFRYMRQKYGEEWWTIQFQINHSLVMKSRKRKYLSMTYDVNGQSECIKDCTIGRDVLTRAGSNTWWDWSAGSTCNFWRWPREIQQCVRDGFPIYVESKLPTYKRRQIFHLSDRGLLQLKQKINKVIKRGYMEDGFVSSLVSYFAVPKGEDDIRVVYDGTKCGLNEAVWAPNFYLPSVDSLLMMVSAKTWFSDLDLGEMFLNYFLDEKLRPYAGVDVSKFAGADDNKSSWLRWNRTLMGFRSSPYIACKLFGWTLGVVRGNRCDPDNCFKWNTIRMNLPGSLIYDPSIPWITKMDNEEEASDVIPYVDDGRPYAGSEKKCREAGKQVAKKTQYLGEQIAARKSRPPSQEPGPWCVSFVVVRDGCVYAYVSQKKWDKAKSYINGWYGILLSALNNKEPPVFEHKQMEQGRGFLVYLSRTYTSMVPYLKGIHLTLDSWREGRDDDGWKLKANARRKLDDMDEESSKALNTSFVVKDQKEMKFKAPKFVKGVPRLSHDLLVLTNFFDVDKAPWRFVRGKTVHVVRYGFGDASKAGFGSTLETENGSQSSNFRELENLAQSLEVESEKGNLKGSEVFLFTDNSTAESAYFKGTSSSKKLFQIVMRLRKMEFASGIKINFIHVAGSRMIQQGTDGLSRGDFSEGVMKGISMLSFIPLHLTAWERASTLKQWIIDWMTPSLKQNESLEFLDVQDWFWRGHDIDGGVKNDDGIWMPTYKSGIFIWSPPPAGGQIAIEQLREARNKRTKSLHVFILPRLFTCIWRRQLSRVADLIVELPFIDDVWSKSVQHEPLTLAFIFPFLSHSPWQLKRSGTFLGMGRLLPKVWKESEVATGFIL